jgi:hypothetical protein
MAKANLVKINFRITPDLHWKFKAALAKKRLSLQEWGELEVKKTVNIK